MKGSPAAGEVSQPPWMPFSPGQWTKSKWLHQWEYDPRPDLQRLALGKGEKEVWEAFWNYLHHQGDVCERSFLAVVALSRLPSRPAEKWQLYSFAATVEVERHRRSNPNLPSWLQADYQKAWTSLASQALEDLHGTGDNLLVRGALAVVALNQKQLLLGALVNWYGEDELLELADKTLGWTKLYDPRRT